MGFAGDVLFSTAALEGIKQKYPKAELTYGVWPQHHGLILTSPHIDKFVHADGDLHRAIGGANKAWEISHEKYKLPDGEMAYWGRIHAMQAAELGLLDLDSMESFKPQIYLASTDIIEKSPKKIAALGVFSKNGADSRLWGVVRSASNLLGVPEGELMLNYNWTALVKGLNKMGFQCVQLGGRTDPRVRGTVDLCGRLNWRQSVGVVMNADVCVTIDSFLLHAAVAQKRALDGSILSDGTPTVAILGPTDGRAMFPKDAERVVEVQARQTEGCPCFHSSRFGKGECVHGNSCMKSITVEQILEGVERCLD